jgi:uncharacterized protein (TIGR03435 family)
MTSNEQDLKRLVDRHLPSPTHMEFTAARDRVLGQLRSTPLHQQTPRIGESEPTTSRWRTGALLTAAAALIALVAWVPLGHGDWIATVEAADGSSYPLQPNTVLTATERSGLQLTLKDGARVEMRSASAVSLAPVARGVGIQLLAGDIIVDAAGQADSDLSVHTNNMTIAVAGTIALVKTVGEGSRVAVIEGNAHVREPARETVLRPGEQLSTDPALATRPLRDDIAWSRHADAHLKILAAFTNGIAQTAGALSPVSPSRPFVSVNGQTTSINTGAPPDAQEFEEASIRECDPDNLPPSPVGARGGGVNSVMATPGRFYALCVTPVALIRTSFGYRGIDLEALLPDGLPRGGRAPLRGQFGVVGSIGDGDGGRVRGGPDWIRKDRFTIEAVASSTADAATMGGPMLRALFARRFKLKTHEETEQTLAYNLVVAPGGLRIKPVASGACDVPVGPPGGQLLNGIPRGMERSFADVRRGQKPTCGVWGGVNGPNWVSVAGEATVAQLTQHLRGRLTGIGVTDKTGITDKFNWDLEYVIDGNAANGPAPATGSTDASGVARAPTIFDAIEQQLGLRLEPVQVPRTYLVIDAIERPSPN